MAMHPATSISRISDPCLPVFSTVRRALIRIKDRLDPTKDTIRALAKIAPKPGEIAIDCGANVGDITEILARRGATVYAFEPNPDAYARLRQRFAGSPNVECIQAGVSTADEKQKLFMHEEAGKDPVFWSTGSSVLEFKSNVSTDNYVEAEFIDLARFILGLGKPVRIVKMDIEGAECQVINHLIDTGAVKQIRHLFVETHDHRIPELREPTDALRKRVADEILNQVDLTWK